MNEAIISLGSNIEPDINIHKSRDILRKKFEVIAESKFIMTKPIGTIRQPDFFNGAVYLKTDLNAEQLKTSLKTIEMAMGRKIENERNGPRVIDLDIIVWNKVIFDQNFYKREYLKKSVLELIPDLKY